MAIPFEAFYRRLLEATDITTQMDLARALGVNRSAITQAKLRNAVPQKWILTLARKYTVSADWLEFGTGLARPGREGQAGGHFPAQAVVAPGISSLSPLVSAPPVLPGQELIYVPKASAKLCAGGGSFEVAALQVGEYPFPRSWLARMGKPESMIFMDVVGDSMEPGILDGDSVLVDQSFTNLSFNHVMAVGVEDAIFLKRVERVTDGVLLHSDNDAYTAMEVLGDEMRTFRVIGKVVWLCRDFRFN